jgi:cytochrome P450
MAESDLIAGCPFHRGAGEAGHPTPPARAGSGERAVRPSAPQAAPLSLSRLLDPEVLADPYPLYHRLRSHDPVFWDPYLHAWVVTRYEDVVAVLTRFSAARTPTPEFFEALGAPDVAPVARVMVKQMLFMDGPAHVRLRKLAGPAFLPGRVRALRGRIQDVATRLIDGIQARGGGRMDLLADFAEPLPAIVTAEMLGVPVEDHGKLKDWSVTFAEMLGNFQHNPDRLPGVLRAVENLTAYFHAAVREQRQRPREGLVHTLLTAEADGDRLTDEEIAANCIVTMVGGLETTTNLIGNGMLSLLRNPAQLARLRADPGLMPAAVEELLRYESPSQHTARLAPDDVVLGGKTIRKRQAVIAVMAAGNRDPERFPDPDRLDFDRPDNRHLAFGWAAHFCFGAPLARAEGQIAFETLLRRFPALELTGDPLTWRDNLGLRGLRSLPLTFTADS